MPSKPHSQQRAASASEASTRSRLPSWASEVLSTWALLFPSKIKPQSRMSSSHMRKLKTRWKDPAFREHWRAALEKASTCYTLQREPWFQFEFFARNDTNWQKMLAGWMDWRDQQDAAEAARWRAVQTRAAARSRDSKVLRDYIAQARAMDHESRCRLADKIDTELGPEAYHTFIAALEKPRAASGSEASRSTPSP